MNMTPKIQHRILPCVAIVVPAEDVPGAWVAHCLTLDLLSQGPTPEEALRLVAESSLQTFIDDLNDEQDPIERKAPADEWKILEEVMACGEEVSEQDAIAHPFAPDGRMAVFAASFVLTAHRQELRPPMRMAASHQRLSTKKPSPRLSTMEARRVEPESRACA